MILGQPQGWVSITLAIVLAVSGFVLPIAVFVYLILERRSPRSKSQKAPKPIRPQPLLRLLHQSLAGLSRSTQLYPLVLVLGERCAGKTSLIHALVHDNGAGNPAGSGDRRLTLRAGKDVVYVELGSELFEDRLGAGAELEKLLARIALRTCQVLFVVNAAAVTYDSAGLAQLGRTARELVEVLTLHRRTPIPLRVCLTHLDQAEPGFVELAQLLGAQRWEGSELRETRQGPVLAGLLHDFFRSSPLLERGLVTLDVAEMDRLMALLARGSSAKLARLAGLYQQLGVHDLGRGIRDESLVLCALRDAEQPLILGDPAKVETALVATDLQHYDHSRFNRALAWGALASVLVGAAYLWRLRSLENAMNEVAAFQHHDARDEAGLNRAEARAGAALRSVLDPIWPPLGFAFPKYTQRVLGTRPVGSAGRGVFLELVRKRYFRDDGLELPYKKRLYAAALLNATRDSALGQAILKRVQTFAERLGLPTAVVSDYVQLNTEACGAPVRGSTPGNWSIVQDVLARSNPIGIQALQSAAWNACLLRTSRMASSGDSEQELIEQTLRASCESQATAVIGKGDGQELPAGVADGKAFAQLLEAACSDATPSESKTDTLLELVAELRKLRNSTADAERSSDNAPDACALGESPGERYTAARWHRIAKRSRAAKLAKDFSVAVLEATDRSPFFADSDVPGETERGEHGLGAAVALPERYWSKTALVRVVTPMSELASAIEQACIGPAAAIELSRRVAVAFNKYADQYHDALQSYYESFRFPYANLAGFRGDLATQLAQGAWFDRFWSTLLDNAQLALPRSTETKPLEDAVAPFASLVALQKDGHIDLGKYSDVLRPYLAVLEERAPGEPGPPLAERLSPLAKKGLTLLDPNQDSPVHQVQQVLDALGISPDLRAPFLISAERIQALAIGSLERAVSELYARELAPSAAALWRQFPFSPLGEREANPDEVIAQLGTKGTLKTAFANVIAPVVTQAANGAYVPAKVGSQPLRVPQAALELGRWLNDVGSALFDDSGKPKDLVLSLRSDSLLRADPGDRMVATNGHVTVGSATVVAINQAPGWQKLSVGWTTPVPAQVGVSLRGQSPSDTVERTRPATGENWQILHLLCDADTLHNNSVAWQFGPVQVAFELEVNPFEKLVAPGKAPNCTVQITDKRGPDNAAMVIRTGSN